MNTPVFRTGQFPWQLLCLLCLAQAAHALAADAPSVQGKVVAYSSATAFAILDGSERLRRIKLSGVDAPQRTQPYAPQARQLAAEWLGTGPIEVVIDKTDKDQRILGRVAIGGRDVGLALLEAGLAWCDPEDASVLPASLRDSYGEACTSARTQRRGLWRDAHPTPPWEHRKIPQFDPLPSTDSTPGKRCQDIGNQTLQCDDGKTYRGVGSQIIGSDGTVYSRRGNTVTGSDGNRYEQQGNTVYGTDGTVCRTRGRRVDCN